MRASRLQERSYLSPRQFEDKVASTCLSCLVKFRITSVITGTPSTARWARLMSTSWQDSSTIDSAGLEGLDDMKVDNLKPQVDRLVFPKVQSVIVSVSGIDSMFCNRFDRVPGTLSPRPHDVFLACLHRVANRSEHGYRLLTSCPCEETSYAFLLSWALLGEFMWSSCLSSPCCEQQ